MDTLICPQLGALDESDNRGPHVEYPSFENRCFAIDDFGEDDASTVMLTDQATFCLSSGHNLCPRFLAAQSAAGRRAPTVGAEAAGGDADFASNWLHTNLSDLEEDISAMADDGGVDRRLWGWIGAGLTFLLVFLCGGTFAAYLGWQVVSSNLGLTGDPVSVDTLAAVPPIVTQQPLVLVITATSVADTPDTPTPGAILIKPEAGVQFPPAVTPTSGVPAAGVILVNPQQPAQGAPPPAPAVQPGSQAPTPTPIVDINAVVPDPPTRRPTPTFEIPTATPLPAEATATITPTYGPAVVIFKPVDRQLKAGRCTMVTWSVRNVREVYYEGLGVPGQGEKEECLDDDSEVYTLMVIHGDGSTGVYTTTVALLEPTPTPTFTPTWTPFPVYTPTWTPAPPPVTPTPLITYGIDLLVSGGSQHTCAAGAVCLIALTVSNLGNQLDSLTVQIVASGTWSAQLCRLDGVCAAGALTLYNVGPGTGGTMNLQVDIPAGAGGQNMSYTLEASSGNTGGAVRSDAILVEISAQ